jgi:hypothetical protein
MAYAKGRAYPILIQMSQKLPEAKQLYDSLTRISQKEFESRFGQLLKSNPSYDTEQIEDKVRKGEFKEAQGLTQKIKNLKVESLEDYKSKEFKDWEIITDDIVNTLIEKDESGWVKYFGDKNQNIKEFKEKTNLGGNQELTAMAKGWYKPPQVVSMDEFYQEASKEGNVLFFRGIKSQLNMKKHFEPAEIDKSGAFIKHYDYTTDDVIYNTFNDEIPYYMGGGMNGDGIYLTSSGNEAMYYTETDSNHELMRFTANINDINVIDKKKLNALYSEVMYKLQEKIKNLKVETTTLQMQGKPNQELNKKLSGYYAIERVVQQSDGSAFAIMLGYDGITVDKINDDGKTWAEHLVLLNYAKFKTYDVTQFREKNQPVELWNYDMQKGRNYFYPSKKKK